MQSQIKCQIHLKGPLSSDQSQSGKWGQINAFVVKNHFRLYFASPAKTFWTKLGQKMPQSNTTSREML